MNWRDALRIAGPLLWEGVRLYAPQIKIPADLLKEASKYFGRTQKGVKKVRKRIGQIDDLITEMEHRLTELKAEREEWVLQWGDLTQLIDAIDRYKEAQRGR
jgi:uncharacterized protein YhaN